MGTLFFLRNQRFAREELYVLPRLFAGDRGVLGLAPQTSCGTFKALRLRSFNPQATADAPIFPAIFRAIAISAAVC